MTNFAIKTAKVTAGGFTYHTHKLSGWLNGVRVRKQFKSRAEAEGEKSRLEVAAANTDGEIRQLNTRLSAAQLAEAEAAFARLGNTRSLSEALDWFFAHYRPPQVATPLSVATAAFLAERTAYIRPVMLRSYKHMMASLNKAFPEKNVHEIITADVQALLASRPIGKKRFNNVRGGLHSFFAFCQSPARAWTLANPVAPIPPFRITHGLPEIISTKCAAELMAFLETYSGGPQSNQPPGFLVPYFALCLFAGLRPSIKNGELAKLGCVADRSKVIDLDVGVIRVMPEQSKVKCVRQIAIRPNLAAWLARYLVKDVPIIPRNAVRMIRFVRRKFGLSPDVLRHTFISMHVAAFRSLGDAALEAGNSETMVRRHYLNLVSEADAREFWKIVPAAVPIGDSIGEQAERTENGKQWRVSKLDYSTVE